MVEGGGLGRRGLALRHYLGVQRRTDKFPDLVISMVRKEWIVMMFGS